MSEREEIDLVRGDGTDRLLTVLYGESSAGTIRHAIGGSNARMLTDAAARITELRAALLAMSHKRKHGPCWCATLAGVCMDQAKCKAARKALGLEWPPAGAAEGE